MRAKGRWCGEWHPDSHMGGASRELESNRSRLSDQAPPLPCLGETGWATAAQFYDAALHSPRRQHRLVHRVRPREVCAVPQLEDVTTGVA